MLLHAAQLILFPALMAFAASSDFFTMTISNRVSLALVAGFCVLALVMGLSLSEIGWHFAAGGIVLVVAFGFFAMGWIGGGDAKLAAATGLWFGFGHLMDYVVYASLLGGVLTVLLLQVRKWPLPAFLARQDWAQRLHDERGGIPYGIALAAAALIVYPHTGWISAVN
jgi:prepilin peptidase CpaA